MTQQTVEATVDTTAAALGRTVVAARSLAGLSRKGLAVKAGISYPYLAEIENGVKNPSSKIIGRVAWALGTTPSALFEAAENGTVPGGPVVPAVATEVPVSTADAATEAIVAAVRAVLAAGGTVTMALP